LNRHGRNDRHERRTSKDLIGNMNSFLKIFVANVAFVAVKKGLGFNG